MDKAVVAAALTELARGRGVFRPNLVRDLDGKLQPLRVCWSIAITSRDEVSTDAARRLIIGNLRVLIDLLEPRQAHQGLTPEQRIKQYQTLVRACFNLPFLNKEPEYLPLRNTRTLTERRVWMDSDAPEGVKVSVSAGQDDLKDAIRKMAEAMNVAGYEPASDTGNDRASLDGGDVQLAWVTDLNEKYRRRDFSMDTSIEQGWTICTFTGVADVFNSPFAREGLIDLYRLGKIGRLIVVLDIDMMDSTFIGVMVGQLRRSHAAGAILRVVCSSFRILKGFRTTGLDRMFPMFLDVDSAIVTPILD